MWRYQLGMVAIVARDGDVVVVEGEPGGVAALQQLETVAHRADDVARHGRDGRQRRVQRPAVLPLRLAGAVRPLEPTAGEDPVAVGLARVDVDPEPAAAISPRNGKVLLCDRDHRLVELGRTGSGQDLQERLAGSLRVDGRHDLAVCGLPEEEVLLRGEVLEVRGSRTTTSSRGARRARRARDCRSGSSTGAGARGCASSPRRPGGRASSGPRPPRMQQR